MDHVELRTKVGGWLQNPANALHMDAIRVTAIRLVSSFKKVSPATYRLGTLLKWDDWGSHIQVLGEWVGPMEITPTNQVLNEMGTDIRVNIYDPRSKQIFGDEENQLASGIDKPIIMVMSFGGHYEWLRLRNE